MIPAFQRRRDAKWIGVALLPAAFFYAILLRTGFNLPRQDDYDSILRFMNGFEGQTGFAAKSRFFLASQYNEYKLYYVHGVVVALHAVTHQVNFFILQQIGNLAMFGIFLLFVVNLPARISTWKEAALFTLPISLFVFSFRSHQTLNWAVASLQNIDAVLFCLACIHFLLQRGKRSTLLAVLFFILSVAASGNGFVLLLTGTWVLLERRRVKALVGWWCIAASLVAAYMYHYSQYRPAMHPISPLQSIVSWAIFPVAFLGNAMPKLVGALPFGLLLLALFVLTVRRGLRRRAAFQFHASVFILATALGVSVARHAGGFGAALPSRYSLYGLTFASLMISALYATRGGSTDEYRWPIIDGPLMLPAWTVLAFGLWLLYIPMGVKPLYEEQHNLEVQAAAWEHDPNTTPIYYPEEPNPGERKSLEERAPDILRDSQRRGVYTMPPFSEDATPWQTGGR